MGKTPGRNRPGRWAENDDALDEVLLVGARGVDWGGGRQLLRAAAVDGEVGAAKQCAQDSHGELCNWSRRLVWMFGISGEDISRVKVLPRRGTDVLGRDLAPEDVVRYGHVGELGLALSLVLE